jgi:mycothiol synthase
MGVVLAADATDVALLAGSLARAMRAAIADEGGGSVNWWVLGSDEVLDSAASDVGLDEVRTLLQLRVPLPLTGRAGAGVEVRAFRPGVDERAWLEVNNAAFHWHPEQGGWDLDTLEQREREPWFDPQGFLLYERDGRVAAFCWTKIHDDTDPVLGEIYVIAVHPDFHGLGLGRALTAAGLQHLADRGIQTGMLYVDGTNSAAISLYQSMGFEVHRIDRAHFGIVPPTPAPVSF